MKSVDELWMISHYHTCYCCWSMNECELKCERLPLLFVLLASFIALHFSSTLVCFSSLLLVYLSVCVSSSLLFSPYLEFFLWLSWNFIKPMLGSSLIFVEVLGSWNFPKLKDPWCCVFEIPSWKFSKVEVPLGFWFLRIFTK